MNHTEHDKMLKDLNRKLHKMDLPSAYLPAANVTTSEETRLGLLKNAKARGLYFSQVEVCIRICLTSFVMFILR